MKRRTTMASNQQPPESYKIYVKMLKTVSLNVNCTDTVNVIKSKLSAIEWIDKSDQELFFAGIHLKNENRLSDYNIMTNSSIDLYITDGIQISVRIPSVAKTIKLNVKKSSSVADVKVEIEQKEGIHINEQTLMYAGQQLEDNQLLSMCDFSNNQTLHVLVCPTDQLRVFVLVGGERDRTISLDVKCWYTIADVKLMIETLEGIPVSTQIITMPLSCDGMLYIDSQTLQNQGIKNNDTLLLEQSAQIFIKTWEGKTLTMVFNLLATIEEVMKKIEDMLPIRNGMYYLLYRGRVLSAGDTLQKHKVERNSTINICLRKTELVKMPEKKR